MLGAWMSRATMEPDVSSARWSVCPPAPHPRSTTAGAGGRSRHRASALAAQSRLPGPCLGSDSYSSRKMGQKRGEGSFMSRSSLGDGLQPDECLVSGVAVRIAPGGGRARETRRLLTPCWRCRGGLSGFSGHGKSGGAIRRTGVGSPGRTRTTNLTVNSRLLYH